MPKVEVLVIYVEKLIIVKDVVIIFTQFFASGNYLVADVGMVAACVLLFLGLIISLVMKFSKLSQKGYTNLCGILTFTLSLGGKKLLYFRYKFT